MSTLLMLSLLAQDPAQGVSEVGVDEPTSGQSTSDAVQALESAEGEHASTDEDTLPPSDEAAATAPAVVSLRGNVGAPPGFSAKEVDRGASMYVSGESRWDTHQVGDLVTVVITDYLKTEVKADTTTNRESEHKSKITALFGLVGQVLSANPTMVELESGSFGAGGESSSSYTGGGATSRENTVDAVLTCTVMEVLDSGNLLIKGQKTVTVNGETQLLVVQGVVRPADITAANTVSSDRLSDANIQTTGSGEVDDRQHSPFLSRVLGKIFPF